MRRMIMAVVVASLALPAAGAEAQDSAGPSDSARYTFYRLQDRFLRLDVRTGQVSECSWNSNGWFCRVVPDERMALESEIARLIDSNSALKKELLAHGLPLPAGIKPDPEVSRPSSAAKAPDEGRPERPMVAVEKVWRRLIEMMGNLQRDMLRKS